MFFPRLISTFRLCMQRAAAVVLIATVPLSLAAQQSAPATSPESTPPVSPQPSQPQLAHRIDYSAPRSAFPHVLQPYLPRELAQPSFGNSARIDSLLHDGKIYLSIDDAIALALENNLDLEIARYNLNIADADLLRANPAPAFSA